MDDEIPWRALCRLEDIPDGGAKEFAPSPGSYSGLFAVRRGAEVVVYENSCPHVGVPLNWAPDRFLDGRCEHIVCGTHGALFRIEDGMCIKGPCTGEALEPIPFRIEDGVVFVDPEAP
ncbi:Rieske (2Fe-2S) protein [Elioraea rosea]|uniref:Rieske (2Fe-2S) protein n=1 Tax=Elioraea rosea TaxID=2492390 RepID=UPI001182FF66|nr:Rieske (2Fe-2S) protein [Elioraea rosea]